MSATGFSQTVTFVPESAIGDMVGAGPWPPEMAEVMIRCLKLHVPSPDWVERRALPKPATVHFTPTDITLLSHGLQLSVVTGEENPASLFSRRQKTYWIFGRLNRTSEFCPVSQHGTMTAAVRTMVEMYKSLLPIGAKEDFNSNPGLTVS